jgi:hypothetical protein
MHEQTWQEQPARTGRVASAYRAAYPDPLCIAVGEVVTLGRRDEEHPGWIWATSVAGVGGWAPEAWLELGTTTARARWDYTARELTVEAGEPLTIHGEEAGWYWATTLAGASGWIPAAHVLLSEGDA